MSLNETVQIYVRIPDEDGAMLTQAISLGNGLYRVLPTSDYDPSVEDWEFLPGTIVRCEWTEEGFEEPLFLAVSQEV